VHLISAVSLYLSRGHHLEGARGLWSVGWQKEYRKMLSSNLGKVTIQGVIVFCATTVLPPAGCLTPQQDVFLLVMWR
jgi:hypothetical protein